MSDLTRALLVFLSGLLGYYAIKHSWKNIKDDEENRRN